MAALGEVHLEPLGGKQFADLGAFRHDDRDLRLAPLDVAHELLVLLAPVEAAEDGPFPHDGVEQRDMVSAIGHDGNDDVVLAQAAVFAQDVADAVRPLAKPGVADGGSVRVDHGDLVGVFPECALKPPGEIHRFPPCSSSGPVP